MRPRPPGLRPGPGVRVGGSSSSLKPRDVGAQNGGRVLLQRRLPPLPDPPEPGPELRHRPHARERRPGGLGGVGLEQVERGHPPPPRSAHVADRGREGVEELLHRGGPLGGHHQNASVRVDDDEVLDPEQHHRIAVAPDHRVLGVVQHRIAHDDVAARVLGTHPGQRLPGPHVVPGEGARHDRDGAAPLQHAHIDRDRRERWRRTARRRPRRAPAAPAPPRGCAPRSRRGAGRRSRRRARCSRARPPPSGRAPWPRPAFRRSAPRCGRHRRAAHRARCSRSRSRAATAPCPTVTSRSCRTAVASAMSAVRRNAAASPTTQSAWSESTSAEGSRRRASQLAQMSAGAVEAARGSTRMFAGRELQPGLKLGREAGSGDHQDPVAGDEAGEPFDRFLRAGGRAGERQQLLGMIRRAERPEAGARATRQEDRPLHRRAARAVRCWRRS